MSISDLIIMTIFTYLSIYMICILIKILIELKRTNKKIYFIGWIKVSIKSFLISLFLPAYVTYIKFIKKEYSNTSIFTLYMKIATLTPELLDTLINIVIEHQKVKKIIDFKKVKDNLFKVTNKVVRDYNKHIDEEIIYMFTVNTNKKIYRRKILEQSKISQRRKICGDIKIRPVEITMFKSKIMREDIEMIYNSMKNIEGIKYEDISNIFFESNLKKYSYIKEVEKKIGRRNMIRVIDRVLRYPIITIFKKTLEPLYNSINRSHN